jgi:hypothetical protein
MDESADKSEKIEPAAPNTPAGTPQSPPPAVDSTLPMVESPKLDGSESVEPAAPELVSEALPPEIAEVIAKSDAEAGHGTPSEPTVEDAASGAPPRSWRFALLAATIALVAAAGSFAGSLTASGIGELRSASATPGADMADAASVAKALKSELAELNAMKSSLDSATHYANAQFATISERLEHVEHAQTDPAQLAHIAEAVDRLNKLNAAGTPETTGSIGTAAPGTPAAPTAAKITDRLLEDWVLEDVHGDRALVASRYGGEYLVTPGSVLPGLGQVDAVKRQDGQWVVVTARGLITEGR